MKKTLILALFSMLFACQTDQSAKIEKWKQEIYETELAFSRLSEKEGVEKAFLTYAAEDVVVKRQNRLVIGRDSLAAYLANFNANEGNEVLTWEPDFVDVASSGDMGYTYGKYIYRVTDSLGTVTENRGVFHTVWRKQPDGQWKFVWD